jgi:serine/threonine-protein kinase
MVMELLRGGTLWDWVMAHGRMPPRMAAQVMIPVLEAIQVAHGAGVIHRDLKPQNILLTEEGEPKVTDFGIARVADRNVSLTKTSAVLGTQGYMAPEQRTASRNVDERSDVYSLGATLYALVTSNSPVDLIALAIDESLLDGVDSHIGNVIRKAPSYKPDDRFQNTAEMVAALRSCLPELPADPPGTPALGDLQNSPEILPSGVPSEHSSLTMDLSPTPDEGAPNSWETFVFAEDIAGVLGADSDGLRGATTVPDESPLPVLAPAREPRRRRGLFGCGGRTPGGPGWGHGSMVVGRGSDSGHLDRRRRDQARAGPGSGRGVPDPRRLR